jgi:hypothetical protein
MIQIIADYILLFFGHVFLLSFGVFQNEYLCANF